MACRHAASGCNSPEGECIGLCYGLKMESELRARINIEGTIFELTKGTDDLAEHPGRIGLWINPTWCGSTVKTYFDGPRALIELRAWFDQVQCSIEHLQRAEKR